MDKIQLRHQLRSRLVEMTAEQRSEQSRKACQHLIGIEQFQRAGVIMIYLALPHEVDTTAIILHAWQKGKTVAVPKVSWQQRHMIAVAISTLETDFSTSYHGVRNPTTGLPMPVEDIDLLVAPGLAFNENGDRLGRGGAYFDRFFACEQLRADKCGLAFSQQIVESLPMEEHDKKVDLLVTDEGVIYCKGL